MPDLPAQCLSLLVRGDHVVVGTECFAAWLELGEGIASGTLVVLASKPCSRPRLAASSAPTPHRRTINTTHSSCSLRSITNSLSLDCLYTLPMTILFAINTFT